MIRRGRAIRPQPVSSVVSDSGNMSGGRAVDTRLPLLSIMPGRRRCRHPQERARIAFEPSKTRNKWLGVGGLALPRYRASRGRQALRPSSRATAGGIVPPCSIGLSWGSR
jgi:hypothetical protein